MPAVRQALHWRQLAFSMQTSQQPWAAGIGSHRVSSTGRCDSSPQTGQTPRDSSCPVAGSGWQVGGPGVLLTTRSSHLIHIFSAQPYEAGLNVPSGH